MRAAPPASVLPKKVLDELDERILWELSRDARLSNAALAERIGVAPSTTLTRVRALRSEGVLRSTHAEIDYRAVGLPLQAIVAVRLQAQARPAVQTYAEQIVALPNVLNIFFLGGQTDFLIHVVTSSPEQLREFVATRLSMDPAVAYTETQIVFDWHRGLEHRAADGGFAELRGDPST
jgi:DNA-binding Lrp family transcriptional regulator